MTQLLATSLRVAKQRSNPIEVASTMRPPRFARSCGFIDNIAAPLAKPVASAAQMFATRNDGLSITT